MFRLGLEVGTLDRLLPWQYPVMVALVWAVVAWCSLALRADSAGVLLLWLPSAVMVVALVDRPTRAWPEILAALFAASLAVSTLHEIRLGNALGLGAAQVSEAIICVSIGRRVLGRHRVPQTVRQLAGIFLAALAASLVSTLVAYPFRVNGGAMQQAWWFMATTLGMLVGTPILIYLRHLTGLLPGRQEAIQRSPPGTLGLVLACGTVLSTLVLAGNTTATIPLLFCGLIFAVLRAGQLGASIAIFGFAAAATAGAQFGYLSNETFGLPPFEAGLALQGYMLLMLLASLPLASALMSRQRLELALRERNDSLRGDMTILKLAKTLAGIGRWQYDCATDKQVWSPKMLELNGLCPELAPDPGDVRHLLPDGGKELFDQLAAHREVRIPYSFEYRISPPGGGERILKMNVYNEFRGDRRSAIFGVAMDVTEQRARERSLDRERANAVRLAAEARKLANTDALTGLANRRCALERLKYLLRASRNHGTPLSVVMFDIDHFKRINDGFGHSVGDEVLVRVADLAQRLVRAHDMVGRIGGEEFVWLLPGIGAGEASQLAERLRDAIARGSALDGLPQVTVSVGLANRRGDERAEDLLIRADRALYEAKDAGRNRVREAA